DTSGDGNISVTDVVRLQSHLLNKSNLNGAYLAAADLNGDGKVTITDLVKSARVVAGKDTIG
ncbi:MAG: dockerin type I repeat-containing protein, partial [Oscillospiraceae bacterium]|nr:dockerin type I repeat-containing protein [Oscillospiraceae bacterium]